jgi:hypothetical protein
LKKSILKNWKLNLSLPIERTGRSRTLSAPLTMIIEEMGSLVVASVRGGAVKLYHEAKNSVMEREGAE